jgi:hypothetical protein
VIFRQVPGVTNESYTPGLTLSVVSPCLSRVRPHKGHIVEWITGRTRTVVCLVAEGVCPLAHSRNHPTESDTPTASGRCGVVV